MYQVARQSAYAAMGENAVDIAKQMKEQPDLEGVVMGDETRLRQIVTNLARYSFINLSVCHLLTIRKQRLQIYAGGR